MNFYPLYLDISKRRCVVVGGGDVAERKVIKLLECDARVVVVSTHLTPGLEAIKNKSKIHHIADEYDSDHIEGSFIVVGATDRDDVNEQIFMDSREMGILVNIVDDPARCDFIVPSVLRRGDLAIAISTGGKSPATAKRVREELEKTYGPEYGILLDIMGLLREKVTLRGDTPDANKKIFESVLDSNILHYIKEKRWQRIQEIIYEHSGEEVDLDALGGV